METFCDLQFKIAKDPEVYCSARLYEYRELVKCPFTPKDIRYGPVGHSNPRLYASRSGDPVDGACHDFTPVKGTEEKLIKKLEQYPLPLG